MRGLVSALIALAALMPVTAEAWTATYSWAAATGAVTYKVEKQVAGSTVWTEVTDPQARPTTPGFIYTGTETGLVLFRVSNCNGVGCVTRVADGLWHNEAWQLPASPISIGVQ